jgi:hypothetical protein
MTINISTRSALNLLYNSHIIFIFIVYPLISSSENIHIHKEFQNSVYKTQHFVYNDDYINEVY